MNLDNLQSEQARDVPSHQPGHPGVPLHTDEFATGIDGATADENSGLLEHDTVSTSYSGRGQKFSLTDDSWLTPKIYRNGIFTFSLHDAEAVIWYYTLMVGVIATGYYFLQQNYSAWWGALTDTDNEAVEVIDDILFNLIVIVLPITCCTIIGHLRFPAFYRTKYPSLKTMIRNDPTPSRKIFFRYVTRGDSPNLIADNVDAMHEVLTRYLPDSLFALDVVTDKALGLNPRLPHVEVHEIVVPEQYRPPGGALFKARALEYAVHRSQARPGDWIVHLDEETRFSGKTLQAIVHHVLVQESRVRKGQKKYPDIGQGPIVYGRRPDIVNYITTLADSMRVADDFGKFRTQYSIFHMPLIGMHGSFVVCPHAVELMTTWDHGYAGSITEDSYFALVAWSKGVRWSWIDQFMYEQSPFTLKDLMKQRRRWFHGIALCCVSPKLPLRYRVVLSLLTLSWALMPLVVLCMTIIPLYDDPDLFSPEIAVFMTAYTIWCYILGFVMTFSVRDGMARYLFLLAVQIVLVPFFCFLEIGGVAWAIVCPPKGQFQLVQKERPNTRSKRQFHQQHQDASNSSFGGGDYSDAASGNGSVDAGAARFAQDFNYPNAFSDYGYQDGTEDGLVADARHPL